MLNLKFLIFIPIITVNCRFRSFQPANFESSVPKFTPFEEEEIFATNKGRQLKTTETTTIPSPSAETLTNKISSRIKMPEKYVADLNKATDARTVSKDFGSFDFESVKNEAENEVEQNLSSREKNSHEEEIETNGDDEIEVTENKNSTLFKVGQLFNVTVDSRDDTVNVNLDHQALREMFSGRGSGGKKSGLERFVPLFILPFLIQSAILPFMVAKIKLLLIKSLFAGKLALMLFLLGALKSHSGGGYSKSYSQSAPFLIKDFPFLPEKRVEHNVPELNQYEKKAEPFVRSLHN